MEGLKSCFSSKLVFIAVFFVVENIPHFNQKPCMFSLYYLHSLQNLYWLMVLILELNCILVTELIAGNLFLYILILSIQAIFSWNIYSLCFFGKSYSIFMF